MPSVHVHYCIEANWSVWPERGLHVEVYPDVEHV